MSEDAFSKIEKALEVNGDDEHSIVAIQGRLEGVVRKFANAYDVVAIQYPELKTMPGFKGFVDSLDWEIKLEFSRVFESIDFNKILESDDPEEEAEMQNKKFFPALVRVRDFLKQETAFRDFVTKYKPIFEGLIQELHDRLSVTLKEWAGGLRKK